MIPPPAVGISRVLTVWLNGMPMQQRAPVLIGAGQMRVLNRRTPCEFLVVNYRFFPYAHTGLQPQVDAGFICTANRQP